MKRQSHLAGSWVILGCHTLAQSWSTGLENTDSCCLTTRGLQPRGKKKQNQSKSKQTNHVLVLDDVKETLQHPAAANIPVLCDAMSLTFAKMQK